MRPAAQVSILALILSLLSTEIYAIPSVSEAGGSASLYEEALIQFNEGEISTSVIHLKNALQADPSFLAGRVLLGRSYLKQGYAALAEKEFDEAISLGADRALIIEYLAEAYLLQLKFETLLDSIHPGEYSAKQNSALLVMRGKALYQLGKLNEAELEFSDAVGVDPDNIEAQLGVATIYLYQKRFDESLELIDKMVRKAPDDPAVWFTRGAFFHSRADFEQAMKYYSRALELDEEYFHARLSRAGVLLDRKDFQTAQRELETLYETAPENPQVAYLLSVASMQNGNRDESMVIMREARDHLDALTETVINSHSPTLFLAGLVYFDIGELQVAKTHLSNYIARHYQEARPRIILARIFLQEGALTKAIGVLEPALDFAPRDFQVLSLLADAYMRRNEYFKASQLFERAAEVAPGDLQVMTRSGINALLRGQSDVGLASLERAFAENTATGPAGFVLVTSLLKDSREEEAVAVAERMRVKSPDNPAVLNLLATAQVESGNYSSARESLNTLIARFPDFSPGEINLAKLDLVEGRLDAAEKQFAGLLEKEPDSTFLMVELARVDFRRGDLTGAIKWLEKAVALDGQYIPAATRLVDLYIRTGQQEQALKVARKLVSKNSEDARALLVLGQSQVASGLRVKAQATLKKASQLAGFRSERMAQIAEFQFQAGDLDGAVYSLEKHVSAYPDQLRSRIRLVELQLRNSMLENAKDGIAEIEAAGALIAAERLSGDLKVLQKDTAGALVHYQRALDQAPDSGLALRVFRSYLTLGQRSEALSFVESWVGQRPEDQFLRQILAEGYLAAGSPEEAEKHFLILAGRGDAAASVFNNLAIIYADSDAEKAEEYARKAYNLDSENPDFSDTLGWLLVQKGRATDGLPLLRNAYVRAANNPEIRYHLGVALNQLGRTKEALEELREALSGGVTFADKEEAQVLFDKLSAQ